MWKDMVTAAVGEGTPSLNQKGQWLKASCASALKPVSEGVGLVVSERTEGELAGENGDTSKTGLKDHDRMRGNRKNKSW